MFSKFIHFLLKLLFVLKKFNIPVFFYTFLGPIDHSDSETESQANEDMSKVCYCRVDAKKFSIFLTSEQISHNRTICSIVHKKLVILCLQTEENVKLQFFITGIVY